MTGQWQPGWYPDPDGSTRVRYYDGTSWTAHYASEIPAPPLRAQTPILPPPSLLPDGVNSSNSSPTKPVWWKRKQVLIPSAIFLGVMTVGAVTQPPRTSATVMTSSSIFATTARTANTSVTTRKEAVPIPTTTAVALPTTPPKLSPTTPVLPGTTAKPFPTTTERATTTTVAVTPEESLRAALNKVIGGNDRKITNVANYLPGGDIVITWAIRESLTAGLTKDSGRLEIVGILKAIKYAKELDYQTVRMSGTFPLVDKFGNTSEDEVIFAEYTRATIDRINYDNINFKSILDLAEAGSRLHPAFKY